MRTLRASLTGTVMLALLGGLSGLTLAQTDGEGNGGFTLTVLEELDDKPLADTTEFHDDLADNFGGDHVDVVEATDPRLSGTWTHVSNVRSTTRRSPADTLLNVSSVRVENEGGTWIGRTEGFGVEGEPFFLFVNWTVLEGQGGYEGLTAIVHGGEDLPMDDVDGMGVIFDFGMPPQPELPAE